MNSPPISRCPHSPLRFRNPGTSSSVLLLFVPQAVISMTRLKDHLDHGGFAGMWTSERGYIVRVGQARAIFLSADQSSRVVGHIAHLLLEVDEAQDIQ